jgi:hypothetical protein
MSETSPKDQAALLWNVQPAVRKPTPGRHQWTVWRNGARIDCELRIHGEYGTEMQLLRDGELLFGQRVPTFKAAEQLAAHERQLLVRDGWKAS